MQIINIKLNTKFYLGCLKESDYLGDVDVDERITIKLILKKQCENVD
jgi:hypothetical protein